MNTRFSTRDRQRVAYDVAGPHDAPTVVLLHDLLGQRSSMGPLRDRLSETARCVSIDLRGHGASATIAGAAIDLSELALDVAAVLAQERIDAAILVGHGLGGAVAIRLAREEPCPAVGVVAIPSPTIGLDGHSLAETDRRAADHAYKGVLDAALDAYVFSRLGSTWRDDLPRPTVSTLRRHAPALAPLIPALAAEASRESTFPVVPTVTVAPEAARLDLGPTTVDAVLDAVRALLDSTPLPQGARARP